MTSHKFDTTITTIVLFYSCPLLYHACVTVLLEYASTPLCHVHQDYGTPYTLLNC